jgi:two-component system, NtrC family, nitrogen regulation sensor histidine kinase NtrY
MIHKNFRIRILVYAILLIGLSLLLAFSLWENPSFFIPLAISSCIGLVVYSLVRYVEKTTKDLTHFLLSLKQGGFTESYPAGNRGEQHQALSQAMRAIIHEFAKLNEEKELHYQYLQALNKSIHIAILSFNNDGTLRMMNTAAKQLLNAPSFSRLSDFKRIDHSLYDSINAMKPEERLVKKVLIGETHYQLGVHVKEIVLKGNPVKIVLLQNLNNELEAKEIEAWYQLIRVLTHEIMNSVTPITSLTAAIQRMLTNQDGTRRNMNSLTPENQEDLFTSISTIASRSTGLLNFVTAYKTYAKPPDYKPELTDVATLVARVVSLLEWDFQHAEIKLSFHAPAKPIAIHADVTLMEQVLINLLKNAMEAVCHEENSVVEISVRVKSVNTVVISVADNGPGIDEETLPKIFIPFFTTKEKGTGIGLSLSRQIVKLHGGNIKVTTTIGKGTVFSVELY